MKVYCKNKECQFYKMCENHLLDRGGKINQFDSDIYKGMCTAPSIQIDHEIIKSEGYLYKDCVCQEKDANKATPNSQNVVCDSPCTHNSNGFCSRREIGVTKSSKGNWVCSLFSVWKREGHFDFSRFPQGGHLDDNYAEKIAADKKKMKSYPKFTKDYDK